MTSFSGRPISWGRWWKQPPEPLDALNSKPDGDQKILGPA